MIILERIRSLARESPDDFAPLELEPRHEALLRASAVSPAVAAARGYRSVRSNAEAGRYGFSRKQEGPGLLVPVFSVVTPGPVTYQLRRDVPRQVGDRIAKYETPARSELAIDCHPFLRDAVRDPSVPLLITEGIRKVDAAVSQGLCCIGLLGVWNWRGRNEHGGLTALPDWEGVALKGGSGPRDVFIAFDSDLAVNPKVHDALARLKEFVEKRGALVHVIYLPAGPGGEKTGLDDYFAGGRTVEALEGLASDELRMPDRADKAAPPLALRNATDILNARRLETDCGADLRYCFAFKKFFVWNGTRWEVDGTGEVSRRGKRVLDDLRVQAIKDGLDEKDILRLHSGKSLAAVLDLIRSEPGIPVHPDELDREPFLLGVRNGVVDLRTGEFREARRGDLITKQCPVEWHPGSVCPRWEQFVSEVMDGDEELVDFLQRSLGYTLSGDCRERVFFVLWGRGRNGKSTLLETVRQVLGDYAVKSPIETFLVKKFEGISNDVARLRGARFVYAAESAEGRRLNEALVKDLTGREHLSARFLYAEFFDFRPQFKLFIGTNHKPVIRGSDQAIWDRIRLIPFDVRFEGDEEDKDLPAKLKEELPGILRWLVDGCLRWQKEGLGAPDKVLVATEEYRTEMDILGEFIETSCILSPSVRTNSTDLYQAFTRWCETVGEHPMGRKAFTSLLEERGLKRTKSNRVFWGGIGVLTDRVGGTGGCGSENQEVPDGGAGAPPPMGGWEGAEGDPPDAGGGADPSCAPKGGARTPHRGTLRENGPASSQPPNPGGSDAVSDEGEVGEWTA